MKKIPNIIKPRLLPSIISGILYGLSYQSFPEVPTGILAWFALVPLLLATEQTTAFKKYLLQVFLVFVISSPIGFWWTAYFSWQAFFVCYFTQIVSILLPFIVHFFLQKHIGWSKALFLLPFHWSIIDWITHRLPHTLQVHYIAYTQSNNTWLIQFSDTFGMWGIGFWVVMMNVILAFAVNFRRKAYYIYFSLWLVLPLGYSLWVMVINPQRILGNLTSKTNVSIIQTNVDSYSKDDPAIVQKIFNEIVGLSDSAVRTAKPDLIVLPETAIPIPLFLYNKLLTN